MAIHFENNTLEIVDMLQEEAIAFLYEAGNELLSRTQRNSKVDTGNTKNSFQLIVDENRLVAIVGSSDPNAIWEEFGTGEYAHEGKGRQSAWFIPVENYTGRKKPTFNGEVVIVYGKEGKAFYKTNGKKPSYALTRAFENVKPKIQRRLEQMGR